MKKFSMKVFEILLVTPWEKRFSENEPAPEILRNLPENWRNFNALYVLI